MQELSGEVLIYDLKINKAYCLNETSMLVYQLCNGNNSIAEISRKLTKKLKLSVPEGLVWLAVNELNKENLLENNGQISSNLNKLPRREAIRKIGLASMIALPLISSLIAPTAAEAQSLTCTTLNRFCTASSQCCSTAPNCNANRCCAGTGSIQPTFNYFTDAGRCTTDAGSNCCSGIGSFVSNFGSIDRCRCA